ncbi:hypothetical protein EV363DRAFT_1154882, partial [Boletus edulis]
DVVGITHAHLTHPRRRSPSHLTRCRPRDDGDPRHSPSPPRKPLALARPSHALVLERRRRHLRLADDGEPLALPNSPSPSLSHALSPSHSPSPSHTITFALRTTARACDDGEPLRSPSSLPLYALTTSPLPSPSYAVARPPHLARPRRMPTPTSHARPLLGSRKPAVVRPPNHTLLYGRRRACPRLSPSHAVARLALPTLLSLRASPPSPLLLPVPPTTHPSHLACPPHHMPSLSLSHALHTWIHPHSQTIDSNGLDSFWSPI